MEAARRKKREKARFSFCEIIIWSRLPKPRTAKDWHLSGRIVSPWDHNLILFFHFPGHFSRTVVIFQDTFELQDICNEALNLLKVWKRAILNPHYCTELISFNTFQSPLLSLVHTGTPAASRKTLYVVHGVKNIGQHWLRWLSALIYFWSGTLPMLNHLNKVNFLSKQHYLIKAHLFIIYFQVRIGDIKCTSCSNLWFAVLLLNQTENVLNTPGNNTRSWFTSKDRMSLTWKKETAQQFLMKTFL